MIFLLNYFVMDMLRHRRDVFVILFLYCLSPNKHIFYLCHIMFLVSSIKTRTEQSIKVILFYNIIMPVDQINKGSILQSPFVIDI